MTSGRVWSSVADMTTPLKVNVKLRIEDDLWAALQKLALAGDRTVAAEMRRALRDHVQKNGRKR